MLISQHKILYKGQKMKKFLVLIIILTAVFVPMFAMSGCSDKTPDIIADNYENVAKDGSFDKTKGNAGESIVFDFSKEVTINTIVLKEKDNAVTSFRLYADDSDTPFYGNDFISGYRYCSFETITLQKLRIEVLTSDKAWEIEEIEAYLIESSLNSSDDFRIMSYITIDSSFYLDEGFEENLKAITQFNLIGNIYLDKDGNIVFKEITAEGKTYEGKEAFKYALDKIRAVNPSAKVVATILGNQDFYGDNLDTEERHSEAMDKHSDKLISNILGIIEEYDLDGVSFDYEYPHKYKSYKIYKAFLKELKSSLPEGKLLTAAISSWQLGIGMFSKKDLQVLDQIEVMAYDSFDERGNHSTFYKSAYDVLDGFRSKGVDMKKINLGIPYYSRPVDGATFWGNYGDVADKLSPWENSYVQEYTDLDGKKYPPLSNYYNGRQLVYDKTAYAVDSGVGGVMIWHMACDSKDKDLSLTLTIAKAVNSRVKD